MFKKSFIIFISIFCFAMSNLSCVEAFGWGKKEPPEYPGGNKVEEDAPMATDEEVEAKDEEATTVVKPESEKIDYEEIYRRLEPANFSYQHDTDPEQYYDIKNMAWLPYPLLRLTSPIYFKNIVIPPGYYLLTPREYNNDWYILFKEAGKVVFIIPVFEKDFTPETFYESHIPKRKMTFKQSVHVKFLHVLGIIDRASQRKPAIETYLELSDLDNHFLIMTIYYGKAKYSMIFRTVNL